MLRYSRRCFSSSLRRLRQSIWSYESVASHAASPAQKTRLVDVRETDEYAAGAIPSAVNVPLSRLEQLLAMSPEDYERSTGHVKPKHDETVVFYCRSGVRSSKASEIADRLGFKDIGNYKGSYLDWTARAASPDPHAEVASAQASTAGDQISLKEMNEREATRQGEAQAHTLSHDEASESVKNGSELADQGQQSKFS
ncbi:hypothetical protein PYCC9005_004424 [Savitreella phatthalungensis]